MVLHQTTRHASASRSSWRAAPQAQALVGAGYSGMVAATRRPTKDPPPAAQQPPVTAPLNSIHDSIDSTIRQLLLAREPLTAEAATALLRSTLEQFDVVKKGMTPSGYDNGTRPVHLVLVMSSFVRLISQLPPSQPAARIAHLLGETELQSAAGWHEGKCVSRCRGIV